jgi:hypothetical protein
MSILVKLEIEIDPEHYDADTLAWVEQLADKGREQGTIVVCEISGIPPILTIEKR